MKKKRPEALLQIQCVDYLSSIANREKIIFFSVPNEGLIFGEEEKPNFAKMMILKKMGLTPGVSDIIIIQNGIPFFVEFKSPYGSQSKNQVIFMNNILSQNLKYMLIRTFSSFLATLKEWGII